MLEHPPPWEALPHMMVTVINVGPVSQPSYDDLNDGPIYKLYNIRYKKQTKQKTVALWAMVKQ